MQNITLRLPEQILTHTYMKDELIGRIKIKKQFKYSLLSVAVVVIWYLASDF